MLRIGVCEDAPARDAIIRGLRWAATRGPLSPEGFRMAAVIQGGEGEVALRHEAIATGWPDGAVAEESRVDSLLHKLGSGPEEIDSPVSFKTARGGGFRVT